jgi:lysophospholipase L1-like esterase
LISGDKNVYFIDGETLWGEDHWDLCTMDRTHPNDLGHFKMAQAILPTIKEIVSSQA